MYIIIYSRTTSSNARDPFIFYYLSELRERGTELDGKNLYAYIRLLGRRICIVPKKKKIFTTLLGVRYIEAYISTQAYDSGILAWDFVRTVRVSLLGVFKGYVRRGCLTFKSIMHEWSFCALCFHMGMDGIWEKGFRVWGLINSFIIITWEGILRVRYMNERNGRQRGGQILV
jgi:hypothetical protein